MESGQRDREADPGVPESEQERFPEYGVWLKDAIRDTGIFQSELARRVGVSRMAVSNWIKDGTVPHPERQDLIEEVLGRTYPGPRPRWRADVVAKTPPLSPGELAAEVARQGVLLRRIADHLGVSTEGL